mmetsp:Transcript_50657/g.122222  ORF Transcript_50657/g.122222 Transcript_50657/m.122222 type:complete len:97 (+) Transcript_50657:74-364(+)
MLLSSTVRRVVKPTAIRSVNKQYLSGGPIPARYKVKKNKFVEEWNGKRKITKKTFTVAPPMAANLLLYVVAVPLGFYTLTRAEFQSKGDRRYKDCV